MHAEPAAPALPCPAPPIHPGFGGFATPPRFVYEAMRLAHLLKWHREEAAWGTAMLFEYDGPARVTNRWNEARPCCLLPATAASAAAAAAASTTAAAAGAAARGQPARAGQACVCT